MTRETGAVQFDSYISWIIITPPVILKLITGLGNQNTLLAPTSNDITYKPVDGRWQWQKKSVN
jgi:hypothetical protein